jgi:hypothetical protein
MKDLWNVNKFFSILFCDLSFTGLKKHQLTENDLSTMNSIDNIANEKSGTKRLVI